MKRSGIAVKFQNFVQPVYKQFNNNSFQTDMSIIDLIFNYGSKSLSLLSLNN
jgi:hypothetical protein